VDGSLNAIVQTGYRKSGTRQLVNEAVGNALDAGTLEEERVVELATSGPPEQQRAWKQVAFANQVALPETLPFPKPGGVPGALGQVDGKNDQSLDGKFLAAGAVFPDGSQDLDFTSGATDVSRVPAFKPRGRAPTGETILYVNGIGNDAFEQAKSAQAFADVSGANVVPIHNATEGTLVDLLQSGADKVGSRDNPAVRTLANTIVEELRQGHDVHIAGHSQGGLICERALNEVDKYLQTRPEDGGPRPGEAERMRDAFYGNPDTGDKSRVKVETFGSAGGTYPRGPRYVHYQNTRDPVPSLVGLGNRPGFQDIGPLDMLTDPDGKEIQRRAGGPGAVVDYIDDDRGGPGEAHDFNTGYLHQRVDFDLAEQGRFQDMKTRGLPIAGMGEVQYLTGPRLVAPEAQAQEDLKSVQGYYQLGLDAGHRQALRFIDSGLQRGDARYVAALMGGLSKQDPSRFELLGESLFGNHGDTYPPNAQANFVQGLKIATLAGTVSKDDIWALAVGKPDARGARFPSAAWHEIARQVGAGTTPAEEKLVADLAAVEGKVAAAEKTARGLDNDLAIDLGRFGAALTPRQQQDYISRFHDLHKAEYGDLDAQRAKLAEILSAQGAAGKDAPLLSALSKDPALAPRVFTALQQGAHTGAWQDVLDLTDAVRANPALQVGDLGNQDKLRDQVAAPATQQGAGLLLLRYSPKEAGERLLGALEPLNQTKDLLLGGQNAQLSWPEFKDAFREGILTNGLEEPADALERLNGKLEGIEEKWDARKPAGKLVLGLSLMFHSVMALDEAGKPNKDAGRLAGALAKAGKDGLEVATSVTAAWSNAGKLATSPEGRELLGSFATLSERLTPFLGVVANATTLAAHDTARTNGDVLALVSELGDVTAVAAGSLQVLLLEAAPLLEPFVVLGEGVSVVGDLVSSVFKSADERSAARRRQEGLLQEIGISDPDLRGALESISPSRLQELSRDMGLDGGQIQKIASILPLAVVEPSHTLDGLTKLQKAFGLKSSETVTFLQALQGPDGDYEGNALAVLDRLNASRPLGQQEYLDALRGDSNPAARRALTWLESKLNAETRPPPSRGYRPMFIRA